MDVKKKIIIIVIAIIMGLFGVTYAFFQYYNIGANQKIIAGKVSMILDEGTDTIDISNIFPETVEMARSRTDNTITFTVSGINTIVDQDIYYEIMLNEGNSETGMTRFNPEDLVFDLIELNIDGSEGTYLIDALSFNDIDEKRIWVDTINKNTTSKVSKTYKLRMWLSEKVLISDTDPIADYPATGYENYYASVRVSVYGDFLEKQLLVANVSNVTEMETALANENIEMVNIISDITTDHVISIDRDVIVNGNDNTISYSNESGIAVTSVNNYVMEINDASVTLKNLKITGTEAAVLVNSAEVTLDGTIDVSGNTLSGIVIRKNDASNIEPSLNAKTAQLVNTDDAFFKPTILDESSECEVNTLLTKVPNVNDTETHYYLDSTIKNEWTQIDNFVTKNSMLLPIGDTVNYQVDGYDGTWSVLGVEDNQLLLISDSYVNDSFALSGEDENFKVLNVELLHNEAATYGNGYGATKARSVNVEDIDKLTGYDPIEQGYGKGTAYEYGNEVTYGTVTKKSNYYSYYPTDMGISEGTTLYKLILGEDGNAAYWLASAFTRTFDEYYNEGIRAVFEQEVQRSYLWVYGSVKTESFGVRAVVYIDDSIVLEKASGTWELK